LKHTYGSITELSKEDEESGNKAEVIETEINHWLELLVNNVDMVANDAAEYLKILQEQISMGFSEKYTVYVTELVSEMGYVLSAHI